MQGLGDVSDFYPTGSYGPTAVDQYIQGNSGYQTDYYNPTQIFTSGNNGGGGSFWDFLGTATKAASGILGTRYAVPQLNPGQLIQTGPNGTTMYQGGANSMYPNVGLPSSLGSVSPLVLLGAAAALFFLMKGN